MQRRFDIGTMMHALYQAEFKDMCAWYNTIQSDVYLTFEDEVKIHPDLQEIAKEHDLHSSCDGVFTIYVRNGAEWVKYLRIGLEIKSMSDPEFTKLAKASKPKEEHKEQTCIYMRALDVPYMWILYSNKSNCDYSGPEPPYFYQFDAQLWKELEARILQAKLLASQGKLPAREEGLPCGWCPFAWTCGPSYINTERRQSKLNPKDI